MLHRYTFSFTLWLTLMTLLHVALMFTAAFFAGVVNSIAGGGTLLTFPLLIWLGLDPKVANATSTVALWPGLFAGLFRYRRGCNSTLPLPVRPWLMMLTARGVAHWCL